MNGHFVRLSARDRPFFGKGMGRMNLAIFENKYVAAPVDLMSGKAGEPDPEGDQITQRNQPQMPPHRAVVHNADAHLHSDSRP